MALGNLGDPAVIPDLEAARESVASDIHFHFHDAISQIEERALPEEERRHRKAESRLKAEEEARRRAEEIAKKTRKRQEAEEKRHAEEQRRRQAKDARRKAENERRTSVQATRNHLGQCTMCGRRLTFVQKLFGKDKHGGCRWFKE